MSWMLFILTSIGGQSMNFASPSNEMLFEIQIEPRSEDNFSHASFCVWFPSNKPVIGILAIVPPGNAFGSPVARSAQWQKVAAEWNYALMALTFTESAGHSSYCAVENGSGQAFLSAITELSKISGHQELESVPIAILGHSHGGQFAYHFTSWRRDRVIVFVTIKGGCHQIIPQSAPVDIPGLFISGELDLDYRKSNLRQLSGLGSPPYGKWCYAVEVNSRHTLDKAIDLALPFVDAVIRTYMDDPNPAGDPTKRILPLTSVVPLEENWLPNEAFARTWNLFRQGTFSGKTRELTIPVEKPPQIAKFSPPTLDFGRVVDESTLGTCVRIDKIHSDADWDSVDALSLNANCRISVTRMGNAWKASVKPIFADRPLGRCNDEVLFRFFKQGKRIIGDGAVRLTFCRVKEGLEVVPYSVFLGTHSDTLVKTIKVSTKGAAIGVVDASVLKGDAVELRLVNQQRDSVTFEATFERLPSGGSHCGMFRFLLSDPIRAEIRVPFVGMYKP